MPSFQILLEPRGAVKFIQMVLSIVAFALTVQSECHVGYKDFHGKDGNYIKFFIAIGIISFILSTALLIIYIAAFDRMPAVFNLAEAITTAVYAFLWLLASALLATAVNDTNFGTCNSLETNYKSSTIIGFVLMLLYIGGTYFVYKDHRDGRHGGGNPSSV
eukprot:Opistho-2@82642